MPTVYDRTTRQPVNLPPDQAAAGLVSGALALDADGAPVPLRTGDGSIVRAAPSQVAQALQTGAYSLLTPHEELAHQVAHEEAAKGALGSIEAGAESALNQATFGVANAVREGTESPDEREHQELVDQYHATARTLGGIAGFGASMLAGGPLFKGAEMAGQAVSRAIVPAAEVADAALGSRLAATAANYATQGALLSSPQAAVQAAFGDPKQAAETLLWGIGPSALLGGVAESLTSGARAAGEAVLSRLGSDAVRAKAQEIATNTAMRAIGAQKGQLMGLSEDRIGELASFLHDNGLIQPGMQRQDIGDLVEAAQAKFGAKIGDTIDALDGELAGADPKKDGKMLQVAMKPGEIGQALRDALDTQELKMPMNADQRAALNLVIDSADHLPVYKANGTPRAGGAFADTDYVKFADAQNFVSTLRKKWVGSINRDVNEGGARGIDTVTPLDHMKGQAYQVAKDVLHKAADRFAIASDNPELFGQLQSAKADYSKVATLEKFAANLDRMHAGNRYASLTDFIHMGQGPFSAATQALGAGVGALAGPGGAMVGSTLGRLPGIGLDWMAKKWMEDRGLVALSSLANRVAKQGPEAFTAALSLESQQRLAATMRGVQDTVRRLATHGIESTGERVSSSAFGDLLGGGSGLTHDQAHDKLASRVTTLASNPSALASAVGSLSAPIATVAPDVAQAYQQQLAQTVSYLQQYLPRPPTPPAPFAPQGWAPTAKDRMAFGDRAEIVNNPMAAMDHVARGTLSDAHLDALRTIYPAIYDRMRQQVLTFAAQHPHVKLAGPERASIAKFLGQPLDTIAADPSKAQSLKAVYQQASSGAGAGGSAPRGKIRQMPAMGTMFSGQSGATPT